MAIVEKLPSMTDKDLASLLSNAQRLESSGTPKQQEQATALVPLIEAELGERKAREPAPIARLRKVAKATVSKVAKAVTPKKAPAKKKSAAAAD